MTTHLRPRRAGGGRVEPIPGGWRLTLPPGPAGVYRLAQVDDYAGRSRRRFPHHPPARLQVRARVHNAGAAGTWGWGWWNDPFGLGLGYGGGLRLPTWPQAAWFFGAAEPNFLSFHPDRAPARGFFAASLRGCRWPAWWAALLGLPTLPLLLHPRGREALRRAVARCVAQHGVALNHLDPAQWHTYALEWQPDGVRVSVDHTEVAVLRPAPRGPLGLVIWVDNQFAAWEPYHRPRWGLLPTPQPVVVEMLWEEGA